MGHHCLPDLRPNANWYFYPGVFIHITPYPYKGRHIFLLSSGLLTHFSRYSVSSTFVDLQAMSDAPWHSG